MPIRQHETKHPKQMLDEHPDTLKESEKFVSSEADSIDWSNLIFLPFHPVFKTLVLVSVLIKTLLGPIQSVYPVVYCDDRMDKNNYLVVIKYCYWYYCDSIYGIDTFLHIVHRQVTDKAMRREHIPKSASLLLLDLLALIPFFRLIQPEVCPPVALWPNVLANNEYLIIYRVTEYFQLITTHSAWKIMLGYTIVLFVTLNCITCFWVLLTKTGLCSACSGETYYDWRAFVLHKLNETDQEFTTFVYGFVFIYSFSLYRFFDDEMSPSAVLEFLMIIIFMLAGYILNNFVVLPKAYAESVLRLRRVCAKYPIVQKNIADVRRRNPSEDAQKKVVDYYKLLWRRRNCVYEMPDFFNEEFPRYLRLEIWQDLMCPLFQHSVTLRKTSNAFQRWICEGAIISYKLPGERFFSKLHTTDICYLLSGVVQIISLDDGITPILSVRGGTIFGDTHFLVPHMRRKIVIRCLTYCEIFTVKRDFLLTSMQKYPADREIVRKAVLDRIKHAKILYGHKLRIRGRDRNDDEGLAWLKKRWWEIHDAIDSYSKTTGKSKETLRCELPREEHPYHCPKYIGQVCLAMPTELKTKSMFTRLKFPWILNPHSKFGEIWHRIVTITVFCVLLLHPQFLVSPTVPTWFQIFSHWTDLIYILDILVSLCTALHPGDHSFSMLLFKRLKTLSFLLDLLATIWFEEIAFIVGRPQYYYTLQFNRLIKVYILFYGYYVGTDIRRKPLVDIFHKITLLHVTYSLLMSHVVFELACYIPTLTILYFFGKEYCSRTTKENCEPQHIFGIAISWTFEWAFYGFHPRYLIDSYIGIVVSYIGYLITMYCKGRFIAYMYLEHRDTANYQNFVVSLRKHYENLKIHPDLDTRLKRYFMCHWKYFKGMNVMYENTLEGEPSEIYWKAQGDIAKKIIGESPVFRHADHGLIKDLAVASKFLILPSGANVFMFGNQCRNVMWIAQGYVKVEYYSDEGEKLTEIYSPGRMLAVSTVFFGKPSVKSYTADTDVEILYIPVNKFQEIYKNYSLEYQFLEVCMIEYEPLYDPIFRKSVIHHREHQAQLRNKLLEQKKSMTTSGVIADIQQKRSLPFEGPFWGAPESGFWKAWLLFRTLIVCLSIVSSSILGGVGSGYRWVFMMCSSFCDCICWIDIIMKLFLTYYNSDGILITSRKKCLLNYLSKGFTLDVIGAFPWFEFLKALLSEGIEDDTCFLINTVCKFSHIYIIFAYFQYITDIPTRNTTFIMTLKWQIVNSLIVMASSHFFMVKCVSFEYDSRMHLTHVTRKNECWVADFIVMPGKISWEEMHFLFAHSLSLAENGMLGTSLGKYKIDRQNYGLGLILFFLGIVFWFITCHTLMVLVSSARGDTKYQQTVQQLERFLKNERIDKNVIKTVMEHFRYSWIRTKGNNIEKLMQERIGVVFRQDLNYFFYRKTLQMMDTLVKGGDVFQKQVASKCTQGNFLPGYDIFREMDLVDGVYIIHRGKIAITKNKNKLITLTKGDMFGQLTHGHRMRPIHITATTVDNVDLLHIDFKSFHSIVNNKIQLNILRNPQHRNDFLASPTLYIENPYDTVEYILRGSRKIQLPGALHWTEARHGTWYSYWLNVTWLFAPALSAFLIMWFYVLPSDSYLWTRIYYTLIFLDFIHLAQFLSEFYTIQLEVVNRKCVYRRIGLKLFKQFSFYLDIFSFVIPPLTSFTGDWGYQVVRLVRLKYFYDFEVTFCRSFKNRVTPFLLKLIVFLLLVHTCACGWVYLSCRGGVKYPLDMKHLEESAATIDFTQWMDPYERGEGCARATIDIKRPATNDTSEKFIPAFVVPRTWEHDYIIALTYILLIHTHTTINTVYTMTIYQVYYKVFVTFFLYLIDIYIISYAMNAAYTKYREMYFYDYEVDTVLKYLNDYGLGKSLQESVMQYTTQLWQRDKGDKLPDIAYEAPSCLRQDLFTALYVHHLDAAPTFRDLPYYFKRQLAARLRRMVIFPGKCIVREGDNFNTTYFIHAGEVEKWYTDENGDSKLLSVLYTNGYFGCIAGLFVNIGFKYSYYSRTVVDLMYLNRDKWYDLLEGYPDIKAKLYESTRNTLKREYAKHASNYSRSGILHRASSSIHRFSTLDS